MPNLGSEKLSAYINDRLISEDERLISDILEIADLLQIDGLSMTIDIKKVFDCANQFFLISLLKQFGFEHGYIKWIKALLKYQESCVFNGGKNKKFYFD